MVSVEFTEKPELSWLIRGLFPATWVVFKENGVIVASGISLTPTRARRAIREFLEMAA